MGALQPRARFLWRRPPRGRGRETNRRFGSSASSPPPRHHVVLPRFGAASFSISISTQKVVRLPPTRSPFPCFPTTTWVAETLQPRRDREKKKKNSLAVPVSAPLRPALLIRAALLVRRRRERALALLVCRLLAPGIGLRCI